MQTKVLDYLKTYLAYAIVIFILMLIIKYIITMSFPTISFPVINETSSLTAEFQMQEIKKQIAVQEQLNFARAVENSVFDFRDYLFSQAIYSLKNEDSKKIVVFYGRIPVCSGNEVNYRGANLIYDFDEKKPKYLEILGSRIELSCGFSLALAQTGLSKGEIDSMCLTFNPEPTWMFARGNETFLVDVKSCKIKSLI